MKNVRLDYSPALHRSFTMPIVLRGAFKMESTMPQLKRNTRHGSTMLAISLTCGIAVFHDENREKQEYQSTRAM